MDILLVGLCVAFTLVSLVVMLAVLKQQKSSIRMHALELIMEAVENDRKKVEEDLIADIKQMREEIGSALKGQQERLAAVVQELGTATNQLLREMAGAQEAQATAAEEAKSAAAARQADLAGVLAGKLSDIERKLGEMADKVAAAARKPARKPEPAPEPPPVEPVKAEPVKPEPAKAAPAAKAVVEPEEPSEPIVEAEVPAKPASGAKQGLPSRKAIGKKTVRKVGR